MWDTGARRRIKQQVAFVVSHAERKHVAIAPAFGERGRQQAVPVEHALEQTNERRLRVTRDVHHGVAPRRRHQRIRKDPRAVVDVGDDEAEAVVDLAEVADAAHERIEQPLLLAGRRQPVVHHRHGDRHRHRPIDLPSAFSVGMRVDADVDVVASDLDGEKRLGLRSDPRVVALAGFVPRQIVSKRSRRRNLRIVVHVVAVVHRANRFPLDDVERVGEMLRVAPHGEARILSQRAFRERPL